MPSPAPSRPSRNPPKEPSRLDRAVEVLDAMAALPPTPAVGAVAEALGWPAAELATVLGALERCGLVESWPDPERRGSSLVMLSAVALARLGLVLAPRGDRWDPDRPPAGRLRLRGPRGGRDV